LSRRAVINGITSLGDIVIVKPGGPRGRKPNEYSLNLDVSNGSLLSNFRGSSEPACTSEQNDTSAKTSHKVVNQRAPFQTNIFKPKDNVVFAVVEKTIGRLNELAESSFRTKTKSSVRHIRARLAEGFTEADLLAVVEDRCRRWKDDPKMGEYLRPETLFSGKFESYLQAARTNGKANPGGFVG